MNLKKIAKKHWKWVKSVNWHKLEALECIGLMASEVGEAANECRGNKPTKKLGQELADVVLRTIFMAEKFGIDIEKEVIKKMAINKARGTRGRRK